MRLQDLILFFKIPMITRKYFFEIYRKLWARALKIFTTPGLGPSRQWGERERERRFHNVREVDYSRTAKSGV